MKKALTFSLLISSACMGAFSAQAQNNVDPSIYPKPKAGMSQHIFTLPAQENEGLFKIEIVASKIMMVDCNRVIIGADLESETLEGWGYNYYKIEDISAPATTMMACPDAAKKEADIELNLDDDQFIRYNSKLPVVIYAPENIKVGYRLWKTDGVVVSQ